MSDQPLPHDQNAAPVQGVAAEADAEAQLSSAELRERLSDAARESAIGKATTSELNGQQVLELIGGWFGLVEAILPGLTFILLFRFTDNLMLSVAVPAAIGVAFILVRLVRRQPVGGAIAGFFGMLISGLIAINSGEGVDYFVLGLWINAIWATALAISMLVGWPLLGVLVGQFAPELANWRAKRRQRLWMHGLTAIWVGVFALRLIVQLPLYQTGQTEMLGTARIIMGVPLYAAALILTAILARVCIRRSGDQLPSVDESASSGAPNKIS